MFFFLKKLLGYTIHKACKKNDVEAVRKFLAAGANLYETNKDGNTPLEIACQNFSSLKLVKLLIDSGSNINTSMDDWPLIHQAALYGDVEVVAFLIEKGADINITFEGVTAMHDLAERDDRNEVIALLVIKGASLNPINREGKTPLDIAIDIGFKETVDLIRKHGGKTSKELEAEGK